ncbi:quercetin dioxygenase-like cupin family protein [Kitasatospora sp. MAP12-15]|uniref:cupin domain-containing protein n=1 Tax=unclassified Kitasatospora TaxID=2633591 RepID=UPI002474F55B|nr:cupin [Kitasatospora sp. MAP12-44]MDH6113680.1 quercetin dioxygenase-like cupin family protein [Kitasatospora sp. MAP12-44]
MHVIRQTEERTITTPAAVTASLAGPSQGSDEVSTWRVEMNEGSESPLHVITRDQVWMVIGGAFEFDVEGESAKVVEGECVVVKGEIPRQFRVLEGPGRALVAMLPDGQAGAPGSDVRQPLPWAK